MSSIVHRIRFFLLGTVSLAVMMLASCGSSPSPPPPAPFVPRPVVVSLGAHGGSITLTTTQSGGYTRDGQPFSSGTTVEGENGNMYRLTLSGGQWSAEYLVPDPVSVMLGTSGTSVQLVRLEDGSYTRDGEAFASGTTVESENGNLYTLTIAEGQWSVEYVVPDPVSVMLGTSGTSVQLVRLEDGSYTRDGQPFSTGTTVESQNGYMYTLTLSGGQWSAEYVVPDPVSVMLGTSGTSVQLVRLENGSYTRDGEPFASGATVESENGNLYRLTLSGGQWIPEYVAPEPSAVALGTSGEAVLLVRQEDGSYRAGDQTIRSGGTLVASNGNSYRLTLAGGNWMVEYVPPPPDEVTLGSSGSTLELTRLEDGSYEANGMPFASGDTWTAENGSVYRLSLVNGEWQPTYEPPAALMVMLGTSGQSVSVTRQEDGSYQTDGKMISSGDTLTATNGNVYRLTRVNDTWSAHFVPPDPWRVELGASGTVVEILQQEDGTYRAGNMVFENGGILSAANGVQYRVTLVGGQWTVEYVPAAPSTVTLGTSGERVDLTMREDGGYEVNGQAIISGHIHTASNGNRYRLTKVGGVWRADFVPLEVTLDLGTSGSTVTLRREEDGRYWLGRTVFESGNTRTAANGGIYRLTLINGTWDVAYVPEVIQVPAGESGNVLVLSRLEDGTYLYGGDKVQSGKIVTQGGNAYRLTRVGNTWSAVFQTGTVTVPLGDTSGTVTLIKQEDGTYTHEGRVVRTGSVVTYAGIRFRLALGDDGWTATAISVVPPPGPGGPGGPSPTRTDSIKDSHGETIRFRESEGGSIATSGTILVVGTAGNDHEYQVDDLVGRGVVSIERTYVARAKQDIQIIVDKINDYLPAYEAGIDPNDHINTGFGGETGLWTQAQNVLKRIFGSSSTPLASTPWRGTSVELGEVDDVLEALEEVIEALSDRDEFERQFQSLFATNTETDTYFGALQSKIRFGSTGDTRFGAYANKAADGDASSDTWDAVAVFAYSPLERPSTADLPARGEATYRGQTVAAEIGTGEPTLYSGTIELTARFSTRRVSAEIRNLADSNSVPWTYSPVDRSNDEDVAAVLLPVASLGDNGQFEQSSGAATVRFAAGRGLDTSVAASSVEGRFVEGSSEAFGIWEVASALRGSFGVTRSTTAPPPRPTIRDSGAVSNTSVTTAPGSDELITLDTIAFDVTRLYRSRGGSDRGDNFVSAARSVLSRKLSDLNNLIRTGVTDTAVRDTLWSDANTALARVFGSTSVTNFGSTYPASGGSYDDSEARQRLTSAIRALGSESQFRAALATDEIFDGLVASALVDEAFDALDHNLTVKFDYTDHNFTRFGAWSNVDPESAIDTSPAIRTGVFAYSPLDQTNYTSSDDPLDFRAVYDGDTLAVDDSGKIYRGAFQLTVDWDAGGTNTVSSFVRDLRNVSDNTWFQHGNLDVGYILFSGMGADSTGDIDLTASSLAVSIRYRDQRLTEAVLGGTHSIEGKFVGEGIDGPFGVIGQWSLDDGNGIDIDGAFGAELLP